MIKTRQEACKVLGVAMNASMPQIKNAYKELVKKYHPDVTGGTDCSAYNRIVEAYKFLCADSGGRALTHTRVMGGGTHQNTASRAEYSAFQRKADKQKKQRVRDFEQKQKDYTANWEKQEADYKRVMEAIEAIRAARAIEAMVWANGLGKDNGSNKEIDD